MKNITLDEIIKYCLYLLVFLFPFFFLPWTVSPVGLNKQMLLAFIVFSVFVLWGIKVMSFGKIAVRTGKISKLVLLVLSVVGLSFAFSISRSQSFWGSLAEADTLFSFILYGFVFFLFANLLAYSPEGYSQGKRTRRKDKGNEVLKAIYFFLAGSGISAVLFFIQSFFKVFPWSFTVKTGGLSPIGSVQALSIFLGGALVILIALFVDVSRKKREAVLIPKRLANILGIILGMLFFGAVFLINFWVAWLGIILGTVIVVLAKLYSIGSFNQQNTLRMFGLPLLVIILSLIFMFVKIPIGNILNVPPEVSPTYKSTIDIASQSITASPKNFLLGSGPATFGYQYSLYRTAAPNITRFWQVRFNQGAAAFPTLLATIGTLGVSAVLLLILVFFWQGFRNLTEVGSQSETGIGKGVSQLQLASFAGGSYFFFSWFFYPLNLSLAFSAFLMLALWLAATEKPKGEVSLYQTPQKTFFIMLLGIFLLAGTVIGFYKIGRKYIAALDYARGLNFYNQESKIDDAIANISKAATIDRKDIYFRTLSQLYLIKTGRILKDTKLPQDKKKAQLQQSISTAETAALTAVQIDPKDSLNWLRLGDIYENIVSLITGADKLAIQSYQKAAMLDPQNPQIPLSMGRVYLEDARIAQQGIVIAGMAGNKDKAKIDKFHNSYKHNLDFALRNFKKARDLKQNFGSAYYFMAQIYELQRKTDLALDNYRMVLKIEPNNKQVKAKINSLERSLQEK